MNISSNIIGIKVILLQRFNVSYLILYLVTNCHIIRPVDCRSFYV